MTNTTGYASDHLKLHAGFLDGFLGAMRNILILPDASKIQLAVPWRVGLQLYLASISVFFTY